MSGGVEVVFGLPGNGVNRIMEAPRTRSDRLRLVQVRHEEAAAFMTCGYAKFTGEPGVRLATSGPGGSSSPQRTLRCEHGRPAWARRHGSLVSRSDRHTHPAGCGAGSALRGHGKVQRADHGCHPRGGRGGSRVPRRAGLSRRGPISPSPWICRKRPRRAAGRRETSAITPPTSRRGALVFPLLKVKEGLGGSAPAGSPEA